MLLYTNWVTTKGAYSETADPRQRHSSTVLRPYLLSLWMESYSVTIQMKATEQYFPVVLFITLYKVIRTFEFGWNPNVTIQMKATEQYFPVVLFIMLNKVVVTFESWWNPNMTIQMKAIEQFFTMLLFISLLLKIVKCGGNKSFLTVKSLIAMAVIGAMCWDSCLT